MPERDPLSVRFDRQAQLIISQAIEQHAKHKANRRIVPSIRVRVPTPPQAFLDRETRKDRLSRYERAWQRAMYYDPRIHRLTDKSHRPSGDWSLKITWSAVPLAAGAPRYATVTVFPASEGSKWARQHVPEAEKYSVNEDARSKWRADAR